MNDRYQKDCLKKKRYGSITAAREVIARIKVKRPETPELYVYQCPHCYSYHLTRSPRRAEQGLPDYVNRRSPMRKGWG